MNTSANARPASLPRLVRLVVVIFLPWVALYKSRKALWVAGLIIRNTARGKWPEDETMLRWADEIEHDGWLIWKPYNKDADGQPNDKLADGGNKTL